MNNEEERRSSGDSQRDQLVEKVVDNNVHEGKRTRIEDTSTSVLPSKSFKRIPGAVLNDRRFLHRQSDEKEDLSLNEQVVDKFYFESYAHLSIHEEMIRDSVRTGSYRKAIMNNDHFLKDKVVLDVGCGTGILSLFCAEAGAKKVYAVEASGMADYAKKVIEFNVAKGGVRGEQASRVHVIKGKVEEIELEEKVDIIVSEWMGYSLLYESMLDSVIVARDRWLKEDGLMFPSTARLYLTAFTDEQVYSSRTEFWQDVYGWDYSVLVPYAVKCAFSEPEVDVLPAENQISFSQLIHSLDLKTVTPSQLTLIQTKDFTMSMFGSSTLHGFCLWFDVSFPQTSRTASSAVSPTTLPPPVVMSTSPDQPPTHWKQSLMYLDKGLEVTQDQEIQGNLQISKAKDNPRFLVLDLHISAAAASSSFLSPPVTSSSSASVPMDTAIVIHKTFHVR